MENIRDAYIVPNGDRILVKRLSSNEVSAGGIILADAAQEKSIQGEVVSVGVGPYKCVHFANFSKDQKMVVMFDKYSGEEMIINKKEYIMLKEDNVIAFVCNADDKHRLG